jgi:hypothetical protein
VGPLLAALPCCQHFQQQEVTAARQISHAKAYRTVLEKTQQEQHTLKEQQRQQHMQ